MLKVRYWVAGGIAVVMSVTAAAAQVYGQAYAPAPGYPAGYVPPPPQVQGYNRVIITDAPMPPNLGRPYPYTGGAQPGVLVMPYQPAYAPPRHRVRKARHAVPAAHARRVHPKSVKTPSRELMAELKKKPSRIKRVAVEDATGTVPVAPQRHRAASAGNSKDVRVIHAEAEVKIIGNDQMSIRLYRKRGAAQANAD